ncbi:MAG: MFS transporter [Cytophagaceae bacterium]
MRFKPSEENLSEEQINTGLKNIVKDGLFAEAMATLTGGAFLVALALKLGASNFQIGILAALPTFSSIFQLLAIFVLNKYKNRRSISVYSSFFARLPLFLISFLPFLFSPFISLNIMIGLLFMHFMFGSISGCSWNSWMKDLVPEEKLGSYFSGRSRLIQMLNVTLSLICAFSLDFVKGSYSQYEVPTYALMFFLGGLSGLAGIFMIAKTPEPKMAPVRKNLFKLFHKPFQNVNFRNLMVFNSFWAFAVNLATPFFSVYLLKFLGLPLSYVVGFSILSQVTNILFIRIWGKYSDKYSNKTILRICAPVYLMCFVAWTFTTMPGYHSLTIPLLTLIYVINGITLAGINLALNNIGLKLAPKEGEAIVFLTARSMMNALFAAIAPIIGGYFADFFSKRQLSWNLEWKSPEGKMVMRTLELQQWDFFFLFAFILGLIALYRLSYVKEKGDVRRSVIMNEIFSELSGQLKNNAAFNGFSSMINFPFAYFALLKRKRRIDRYRINKKKTEETWTLPMPSRRKAVGG